MDDCSHCGHFFRFRSSVGRGGSKTLNPWADEIFVRFCSVGVVI